MPQLKAINHLAFITPDMTKTVHFYRDLLGLELRAGVGHGGYRHYFLQMGENQIAFFEYQGASKMVRKFHGERTEKPLGFDHVSFTVDSVDELFAFKDKLEAAGVEVVGAIDHGTIWSIYFFDPNEIPLEISWACMEISADMAIEDDDPLAVADEGAEPQPGRFPAVQRSTPRSEFRAKPGNGFRMRDSFVERGLGKLAPQLQALLAEQGAETHE
ncbi:MAG: VOC family protein [Myxococcales bacterium]|nr:VOC family protein [Myxococcales bacterium]